jgi:hypothetical protein
MRQRRVCQGPEGKPSFRREDKQHLVGIRGRDSRLTTKATLDEEGNLVARKSSKARGRELASAVFRAALEKDGSLLPKSPATPPPGCQLAQPQLPTAESWTGRVNIVCLGWRGFVGDHIVHTSLPSAFPQVSLENVSSKQNDAQYQ